MALRLRSFISPIRTSLSSSTTPVSRSLGLLKSCAKNFEPILPIYASKFEFISGMQRTLLHNVNSSGRKLFAGSFLGLSAAAGMIYNQSTVAYAMNDCDADYCEPSGFLKDDLNTFWFLARKFELPIVLILTVLVGWRHPFALAVNIALLLLCTKPSPSSIYMFIEQVRQKDMNQKQRLLGNRFLYVKNVNVEDYRVLCLAKIELRDVNLHLIGILGGWWVFMTAQTKGRQNRMRGY